MNMHRYFATSVVASLVLGMVFVAGPLFAQNRPANTASHANAAPLTRKAQQQTFTGTIVKSGGSYVLEVAGTAYQLSDQTDAAKYVGKQVKVTGVLNASTDTIRVSNIQPAM
jgi:hypothetical protein